MRTTGIYKITCIQNGKVYIGSSKCIEQRWQDHIKRLNNQQHCNLHLQQAWNKYGPASFELSILDTADGDLLDLELVWILLYNAFDKRVGFNKAMPSPNQAPTSEVLRHRQQPKSQQDIKHRQDLADRMRAFNSDPDMVAKRIASHKASMNDPSYGSRVSKGVIAWWKRRG